VRTRSRGRVRGLSRRNIVGAYAISLLALSILSSRLWTHSAKLAGRRSRACPDRAPRPRQQNQPALVLLA
jgi:hypothetical protein